jgi:CheY-like chemotaxis protein
VSARAIAILLVEDNPADVLITREALLDAKIVNQLQVVEDGAEALDYLRRQGRFAAATRPDLILLDLNLPGVDGRDFLAEVKKDPELLGIPVVILTSSRAPEDVMRAYRLHANCFISKPVDHQEFIQVLRTLRQFWINVARLPSKTAS